jgi:hypothetical protein
MFCRPGIRQNLPPPPPLHTAHPINFHLMNRPSKKNSTRIALTPPPKLGALPNTLLACLDVVPSHLRRTYVPGADVDAPCGERTRCQRRRMQWARSDIVAHAQSATAATAGPSNTAFVESPRGGRKIHGRSYSHCRCHHCTLMCQSSKQLRHEFSCHFRLVIRLWTPPWQTRRGMVINLSSSIFQMTNVAHRFLQIILSLLCADLLRRGACTGYGRKWLVNYYLVAVKLTSSTFFCFIQGDRDVNSCWNSNIIFNSFVWSLLVLRTCQPYKTLCVARRYVAEKEIGYILQQLS